MAEFEIRTHSLEDDSSKAREYWTAERKKRARPLSSGRRQLSSARAITRKLSRDSLEADGEDEKPCFESKRVEDIVTDPFAQVGKLFVVVNGVDEYATAWVAGKSAIVTAGHVVHKGGSDGDWHSTMYFEAQYDDGASAGGTPVRRLASLKRWVMFGDSKHDIAVGIVDAPIGDTTGKLNWLVDQVHDELTYTQIGYPGSPHPGGPYMWQTIGDYLYTLGGKVNACGDMVGGASGGPWVVRKDGAWHAVGLTSHASVMPDQIISPYFGDNFLTLMKWLEQKKAV